MSDDHQNEQVTQPVGWVLYGGYGGSLYTGLSLVVPRVENGLPAGSPERELLDEIDRDDIDRAIIAEQIRSHLSASSALRKANKA